MFLKKKKSQDFTVFFPLCSCVCVCVCTQIASFQCVSGVAAGLYHCMCLRPSVVTSVASPIQRRDKAFWGARWRVAVYSGAQTQQQSLQNVNTRTGHGSRQQLLPFAQHKHEGHTDGVMVSWRTTTKYPVLTVIFISSFYMQAHLSLHLYRIWRKKFRECCYRYSLNAWTLSLECKQIKYVICGVLLDNHKQKISDERLRCALGSNVSWGAQIPFFH